MGVVARVVVVALVIACAFSGCTRKSSDRELRKLEVRQRDQEARLAALQTEIVAAEARLVAARRVAELEQCRADASGIAASVSSQAAACAERVAAIEMCKAANERSKGEGMTVGCGLGFLAAVATGGSSLLLTGAGCVAGGATADTNACEPLPECVRQAEAWMRDGAHDMGRQGLPICEFGVEVLDVQRSFDGGLVIQEARGGAASAGLTSGDVLISAKGKRIRTRDDLRAAVRGEDAGTSITVKFVRNAGVKEARARLYDEDGETVLGIAKEEAVSAVPYVETVIVAVAPAARHDLVAGDVIVAVGDQKRLQAAALARFVRANAAAPLSLKLTRRGRSVTAEMGPLAPPVTP